ncbi:MAG: glycosyltransferase [Desulfohalobiaceae bacterium]
MHYNISRFELCPRVGILGLISKHPHRNYGGSAVSIARIANSISELGFESYLFTRALSSEHFLKKYIYSQIIHKELTGHHRVVYGLQLLRFIYQYRMQVLIAFDSRACYLVSRLRFIMPSELRVYAFFRNSLTNRWDYLKSGLPSDQQHRLQKIRANTDKILANSHGLAVQISHLLDIDENCVGVVPNGVISNNFWHSSQEPIHHPWLLDQKIPVILGVGRLSSQKDWPTLLKAFALLRSEKRCRLIILGEGEEREKLISLAHHLNIKEDVDFPGFVSNPLPWMKQASVFALSSTYEGLPNVLIEAMALGTPAVATDCPFGPAEIIANLGNGLLVSVGDFQGLSSALKQALSQQWSQPCQELLKKYESKSEIDTLLSLLNLSCSH